MATLSAQTSRSKFVLPRRILGRCVLVVGVGVSKKSKGHLGVSTWWSLLLSVEDMERGE
jgi:hypothetical protein